MIETSAGLERAATILKLLGDKTRLTMMKLLEGRTLCVCELVELFEISQPAISQHLRKLKDAGLVKEEKRGQWVYYSVNKESSSYPFVKQILDLLPNQEDKLKELEMKGIGNHCKLN